LLDHFIEHEKELLCIALELVPNGKTLETFIQEQQIHPNRLSLAWRVKQLISLLEAIEYAHERKIIHRDIKLGNILVRSELNEHDLKLVDFGIASLLFNHTGQSKGQTVRSFYSLPFAAPERIKKHESSYASDYYSFGLVAASLLTWQVPPVAFSISNLDEFLLPLKTELADETLYQSIQGVIKRSLSVHPTERSNPAKFKAILESLLNSKVERIAIQIVLTQNAKNKLLEFFDGIPDA
jgi:serine/threonine protein kinase